MKTLTGEQLRADRHAAGLTYEDACLRYTAAWIELHAIEMTLNNANVKRRYGLSTLAQLVTNPPIHLSCHPEFISDMDNAMPHVLAAAALERHEEILALLAH